MTTSSSARAFRRFSDRGSAADEAVDDIEPARIADPNLLSTIDPAVLSRMRVFVVGYGSIDGTPSNSRGTRRFALIPIVDLEVPPFVPPEFAVANWLAVGGSTPGTLGRMSPTSRPLEPRQHPSGR